MAGFLRKTKQQKVFQWHSLSLNSQQQYVFVSLWPLFYFPFGLWEPANSYFFAMELVGLTLDSNVLSGHVWDCVWVWVFLKCWLKWWCYEWWPTDERTLVWKYIWVVVLMMVKGVLPTQLQWWWWWQIVVPVTHKSSGWKTNSRKDILTYNPDSFRIFLKNILSHKYKLNIFSSTILPKNEDF